MGACSQGIEEKTRGEPEEDWSGIPMPGQFPMSNWLVNKLEGTRDDVLEPILLSDRLENPEHAIFQQCDVGPGQATGLGLVLPSSNNVIQDTWPRHLPLGDRMRNVQSQSERPLPESPMQVEFACDNYGVPTSPQDKPNHCAHCNKQLSGSKELRRHIQTVHQRQKVQCLQCDKWFVKRNDNLRRHMIQYCKSKPNSSGTSDGRL